MAKWFMDELFPLSRFGVLEFEDDAPVKFAPVFGDQSFDVLVHTDLDLSYSRLEITHAGFDYEMRLRMEHLADHGGTALSGEVRRLKAPGGSRGVEIERKATSLGEERRKIFDAVEERVAAKARLGYESDVALLVAFTPMSSPSARERRNYGIQVRERLAKFVDAFPEIFLVATHGDYLISVRDECAAK